MAALTDGEPLLVVPERARWLFVFAHGAGAGATHPFMEGMAQALANHQIGTLRYNFPYMSAGRKLPDRPPVLVASVREAFARARAVSGLRKVAGGKSLGGRMTSLALAQQPEPDIEGCVFLGFPLHPANQPGVDRAAHLTEVQVPMLFCQGTRDALATPALLGPIVDALPRAELVWIADANHTFEVPKRLAPSAAATFDVLATRVASWLERLDGEGRYA